MIPACRRFLAIGHTDRLLLARAYAQLLAVDIALRTIGFRRLLGATRSTATHARAVTRQDVLRARRYARWLDAASRRHFIRAACLHRSLALHRTLAREGLPSQLRIGVRKERAELRAHAWVELGGVVVNDRRAAVAPFTPLVGLGQEAALSLLGARTGPARQREVGEFRGEQGSDR